MGDFNDELAPDSWDGSRPGACQDVPSVKAQDGKGDGGSDCWLCEDELTQPFQTGAWAGLIPSPEELAAYPEEVRGKIVQWTDAMVLDESGRQTRLVGLYARNSLIGHVITLLVSLSVVIGSLVAFVITGDPAAFAALALPGANVAGNVIISTKGGK